MGYDKEKVVNAVLLFITEKREEAGQSYDFPCFNFAIDSENRKEFESIYSINSEIIDNVLNTCLSRKFIKNSELGCTDFSSITLTTKGHGRAMSYQATNKLDVENEIDNLLIFMMKKLESKGHTLHEYTFDFVKNGRDFSEYRQENILKNEDFITVVNTCIARSYVERVYITQAPRVNLTQTGQGRAISVQQTSKQSHNGVNMPHIQNANFYGNTQVGNGNNQKVTNSFNDNNNSFNTSNLFQDKKKTFFEKLLELLKHPIVSGLIVLAIAAYIGLKVE